MTIARWFGLVLISLAGFSNNALPAPAQRGPAQAPPGQPAPDQGAETRIAAVVNDEVVSVADVRSRLRMVMLSSNFPDSPETQQRIAGQVLRTIVDEKLQMQEAKKQNVTATDAEVNKAISQIEKQNNMQPGQLDGVLKARGIERGALVDQLTASIVWAKLVRRLFSQTSTVSDEEIDDALKRLKETINEPQSRVAEIFLAVDNPQQDDETRRLAERLVEQMKRGARFSAVAQQFSQSATAAVGGDLGWLRPEQLSPDLGKVVAQLRPGELSPPIRTGAGYYLMLVLDRRNGRSGAGADAGHRGDAPGGADRGAEHKEYREELRRNAQNRQGEGVIPTIERRAPEGQPDRSGRACYRGRAGGWTALAADCSKEWGRGDHGMRQGGAGHDLAVARRGCRPVGAPARQNLGPPLHARSTARRLCRRQGLSSRCFR